MVLLEEVDGEAKQTEAADGGQKDGTPAAVLITGAGWDGANGLYLPTGKLWHDAPILENDQKCLLSREPHKNQKTGLPSFGWIIGQDRKPLYAVQSEALVPPSTGWRKFNGAPPLPQLQVLSSKDEAARTAGQAWRQQGNQLFAAKMYEEAVAKWTRALGFVSCLVDTTIHVALYANRAEAKIRQKQWEGALSDAQAALQLRPTHEKALLRATVAARELRRLAEAQVFVKKCLEVHPESGDGKQLLEDLESRMEEERHKDMAGKAQTARAKLQESIRKEAADGDISKILQASSKKGLKAFEGYSDKKTNVSERPPLSSLPYHHMGLPKEQTDLMDNFFRELREKKDAEKMKAKSEEEKSKAMTRQGTEGEEAPAAGKTESWEDPPSGKATRDLGAARLEVESKGGAEARAHDPGARERQVYCVALSKEDAAEIDALFEGAGEVRAPDMAPTPVPASKRRERIQKAKAFVGGAVKFLGGRHDRRTARERQLDEEEAEARQQRHLKVLAELRKIKVTRHGEPTKFEQAAGEVYCWWKLPADVSGKDVTVKASQGGSWLKVTARGVVIFDRALFDQIRADDLLWSVDNGELHATLTKGERHKLWEQLGEVSQVQKNEIGEVMDETLPEPLSGKERIDKFQEMIAGDDGSHVNFDDLDRGGKELVDAMRRWQHARATGDNDALSLAEMDLEEFGKLVV